MEIYQPNDDTYFLAEFLKNHLQQKDKNLKILEMGVGNGFIIKTLAKKFPKENLFAADINKKALEKLKGFKTIHTNLFSKISQKFDLIIFNPPYLPNDKEFHNPAIHGGKQGDETILKFLSQAKNHLTEKGKIILLISSITPSKNLKKFNPKILARKKLFFEELYIISIPKQNLKS